MRGGKTFISSPINQGIDVLIYSRAGDPRGVLCAQSIFPQQTPLAKHGRGHGRSDPICAVAVAHAPGWKRDGASVNAIVFATSSVSSSRTGIENNLQAKLAPVSVSMPRLENAEKARNRVSKPSSRQESGIVRASLHALLLWLWHSPLGLADRPDRPTEPRSRPAPTGRACRQTLFSVGCDI